MTLSRVLKAIEDRLPHVKRATRLVGHLSLIAAAVVSLYIVRALQPATTGATILLGAWLLLPYVILALVLETHASASARLSTAVTALLVAAGGLVFLILAVFINPDPQGGIAVLLTPSYQVIAIAVLLPITRRLFARRSQ